MSGDGVSAADYISGGSVLVALVCMLIVLVGQPSEDRRHELWIVALTAVAFGNSVEPDWLDAALNFLVGILVGWRIAERRGWLR